MPKTPNIVSESIRLARTIKVNPTNKSERALLVLVNNEKIVSLLAENDPKALAQCQMAIFGKSWEQCND